MNCPCQSKKTYEECCEKYHKGRTSAPTAEMLMRSRYSAYVLNDTKYLYKSWSKTTRPSKKLLSKNPITDWLGLTIVRTEDGTIFDTKGVVEFIARFIDKNLNENQEQEIHETSRFIRENGKWVYLDGKY